jgi:hypothetical protein
MRDNRAAAQPTMWYLKMAAGALAAVILILWYESRSVVDNYSVAGILSVLSCIVVLGVWAGRSPRQP